jgi:hypothetical protein
VAAAAILVLTGALAAGGCGGDDDRPSREEARRCLEGVDLHVTVVEPAPVDRDAPDAELIANDVLRGRVMLFAGYYDDEDRAERYEPAVRRNARSFDGAVERHGMLTLLWVRGHESRFAERARACLL